MVLSRVENFIMEVCGVPENKPLFFQNDIIFIGNPMNVLCLPAGNRANDKVPFWRVKQRIPEVLAVEISDEAMLLEENNTDESNQPGTKVQRTLKFQAFT